MNNIFIILNAYNRPLFSYIFFAQLIIMTKGKPTYTDCQFSIKSINDAFHTLDV